MSDAFREDFSSEMGYSDLFMTWRMKMIWTILSRTWKLWDQPLQLGDRMSKGGSCEGRR